jgi:hypothetical protein
MVRYEAAAWRDEEKELRYKAVAGKARERYLRRRVLLAALDPSDNYVPPSCVGDGDDFWQYRDSRW